MVKQMTQDDFMPAYPLRWLHLQRGKRSEALTKALIYDVAWELSRSNVRLSTLEPSIDIDLVDLFARLETDEWTMIVEISVRSSSRQSLDLGNPDSYGSIRKWLERGAQHHNPCLLFFIDLSTEKTHVLTPSQIKQFSANFEKRFISTKDLVDASEYLLPLFQNAISQQDLKDAKAIFS
jgi:hypothetical protein